MKLKVVNQKIIDSQWNNGIIHVSDCSYEKNI